jgi:alanyl-tRNA synthetase
VVSAASAPDPTLVVARAKADATLDLRTLVPELLAAARGKGGGSPDMITVAAADAAGANAAFAQVRDRLAAHAG